MGNKHMTFWGLRPNCGGLGAKPQAPKLWAKPPAAGDNGGTPSVWQFL